MSNGRYSVAKAKRAVNHAKLLQRKIDKIRKNTRLKDLESRVKEIATSIVLIPCPSCHTTHTISLDQFIKGNYTKLCVHCKKKKTEAYENEILERIKKTVGKNAIWSSGIDRSHPRHCIVIYLDEKATPFGTFEVKE